MEQKTQREKAIAFRKMHFGLSILVLPNAWDVAIFEAAGFSAVGTTSAGIAATLGYPTVNEFRHVKCFASFNGAALLDRIVRSQVVRTCQDRTNR